MKRKTDNMIRLRVHISFNKNNLENNHKGHLHYSLRLYVHEVFRKIKSGI